MNISQAAQLKQKQMQHLTRSQMQGLELLQCPFAELEQYIALQLAENPLLEELPPEPSGDDDVKNTEEESSDEIERDEWGDEVNIPDPERQKRDSEMPDFWLNRPAPEPTLVEQLDSEIATSRCSQRTGELAMEIAGMIDDSGYLKTPLADIAMTCDADMDELEQALELIQSFDPAGIGARNLEECLKLQLKRKNALTPLLDAVISTGLEDIEHNRIPKLASKLGVTIEELSCALEEIRRLDPVPGRRESRQGEQVPVELEIVRKSDGSYLVRLTREQPVRVGISSRYEKLLTDTDLSEEDRNYLKEKLASARELVRTLEQRKSTLLRLGEVIAEYQKDFLDSGKEYLHSYTMKQAAQALEVHETTVSRAVDGKYVSTPHGVFPLRYFFSAGFTGSDGQDISANAVKQLIKEYIADEDSSSPLSDEKLAGLLKQAGLSVARRTVAKYREAMKIPAASLRKKY